MKVEKTYKQLLEFQGQVQAIADKIKNVDNPVPIVQLNRLLKKATAKHGEEYEEKVEDLRLKLCIRDEKTRAKVLSDKGHYQFTEENEKAFRKESKELQAQTIEIHYNEALPYQELLSLLDPKQRPYFDWEDVKEVLEPFYFNNQPLDPDAA
jgi:hypothetical protein